MADAHQVFDTMPEPTKQANMSQIVCQAVVITNEDTSINNDYFTHKQQLFDTPDALNASYFHDMVIIKANQKHILLLQSLISPSCAAFHQTHNEYGEFYSGNSYYLEYLYLQVTSKPSPSFIEIGSRVLYKGAMNIDYDDLVWNMISEPICFCRFVFDPGVLLKWVINSEFFPHSKLLHSGEKLEVEVDIFEWMDNLVKTFQLSYFHNFVNCLPSTAIHYQIVRIIALNNHAHMIRIHLKTLNSCGSCTENTDLMIVHYMDLEPCLSNVIHNLSHGLELVSYDIICPVLSYDLGSYMSTSKMSDQYRLFDSGILVSYTLVLFVTYTLEDKGDFSGEEDKVYSLEVFDPGGECLGMICECLNYVFTSSLNRHSPKCDERIEAQFKVFDPGDHACIGSDNKLSFQMKNYDLKDMKIKITRLGQSYLAIWGRMSNLICVILRTMTCGSLCFDPGGLQNNFCVVSLYGLLRVATCMESTCVWIFDRDGNGNLSVSTSIMSALYLVFVVGTTTDGVMYRMFFSRHENDPFQSVAAGYMRRQYREHHGFATVGENVQVSPKYLIVGHMKQLSALGYCIISTHSHSLMDYSHLLLGYDIKNQTATILVFDPGGLKSWLKMMTVQPQAYQCGVKQSKAERYENHRIFVFDPGGYFIIQDINAMLQTRYLVSCYALLLPLSIVCLRSLRTRIISRSGY